MQQASTDDTIA